MMTNAENDSKKSRGRPATGQGKQVVVRMHEPLISQLDKWIEAQDKKVSRPEAVRRLLSAALNFASK